MPTRITFDITQTDFILNPNENYTIKFGDGFMIDSDGTANLDVDIFTFNTSPVFITATVGPYYPNEKSLFLSFNKNVSYNAGSIYIYAEDSTLVREIDSTTLSTVDTDSNLIEVPIPFPAEALEDNARYWVVLDDDLFVSTSDRVVTKFNSWTNGRTEFEFATGADGLDDFVAWLDASESTFYIDPTKIVEFDSSVDVSTSFMCHPFKIKAFPTTPTYQQLMASTVFQSYTYRGSAVAAGSGWYMEHIYGQVEDTTDRENILYFDGINYSNLQRQNMRSLTIMDRFDHENKTYLPNTVGTTTSNNEGEYIRSQVFGINEGANATEFSFDIGGILYYPNSYENGLSNPPIQSISIQSFSDTWMTTPINDYSQADGYGVNLAVTNPVANNNVGYIDLYKNFGESVIRINNATTTTTTRTQSYFGRDITVSHKYVAVIDYDSDTTIRGNIQIFDLEGNHIRTIVTFNDYYSGSLSLMKHPDTEDYICYGNDIYDITDGSLHQTLNIGSFSTTRLRTANSETHLAIVDYGSSFQTVYLFDTTTDSFSSVGTITNPNTNTNNTNDSFGKSLDISQDLLVVGAPTEDQEHLDPNITYTAFDGGTVYIYK